MTLVTFLLAVNYGNNLVYGLCFLLVGLALVALFLGYRNFSGLSLRFLGAQPVFGGQSITFRFAVATSSHRDHWGLRLTCPDRDAWTDFHLVPGGDDEVGLPVPSEGRGLLSLSRLRLASRFPLGLIEYRLDLPQGAVAPTCLVYPALNGDPTLPEPHASTGFQALPEATDPAGARPYSAGDPVSWIDWKASARSMSLMTKEFDGGDRRPALWLDFEMTAGSDLEDRLSQLCAWVVEAQRHGVSFGLALPGFRSDLAADRRHVAACLRALALYQAPADA